MKNEPPKPKTEQQDCPGCGLPTTCQTWRKGERVFQSLDCLKCQASWGRVVGGSGAWISLGAVDGHGLLLSRKPHGVTEVKKM